MSKLSASVFLMISFLIGILIGVVITQWDVSSVQFLDIKLIEIINLLVTIALGIFIAYFIGMRINNDLKKRELLSDLILKFQTELGAAADLGDIYMDKPSRDGERQIKIVVKKISMTLSIIKEAKEKNGDLLIEESIYQNFLKFKKILTDTPFGEHSPVYDEERKRQLSEQYSLLLNNAYQARIKLYS